MSEEGTVQAERRPGGAAAAAPRDAAAVILVRGDEGDPEVFWARRGERLAFQPGFYAFPGGQRDESDAEAEVDNAPDAETAAMMACAARELFEELGVLAARGSENLTKGQLASVLDDLTSGRMTFAALLRHYGLRLDARDFAYAGRWVTPPFSPRRFDTLFFVVRCPRKQEPRLLTPEFDEGGWERASEAYARWRRFELMAAPPVTHAVRTLAAGLGDGLTERLLSVPEARREPVRRIEFLPGFVCVPLRTPTKPPATTTNCYVVGSRDFVVFDPGSPHADEQDALFEFVRELQAAGRRLLEIVITHHHHDHVGGVERLREQAGGGARVAAHRLTAEELSGAVRVDRFVEDGETLELEGDPPISLRAMHTPGHTRGHLSFYDERAGALLTGDNVVGFGSVLIDPEEGSVRDYLASLERYRGLPRLVALFGGHGPAVGSPRAKLDEYVEHRLMREREILAAVRAGAATPAEIVAVAYVDVHPKMHALAARAVSAHLLKLEEDGLVRRAEGGRFTPNP
ncbi:MAG TPA: MBL fold metallo-hydrolase [Pyrinomonadaceae bacterium]|jgi:glyoxylase-like metal-dependent hydrolase (beta-lactamase superfamily II)/8-oxo-dGTP pyrophosphatase MutT (NUDIX family)